MTKKIKVNDKIPSANNGSDRMKKGKSFIGEVVSDKMGQVLVVEVVRFIPHPLYGKRMKKTTKFHAKNTAGAKLADKVVICETRPLSKSVTWEVCEITK